jgi:hypothetical protein
MHIRRNVTCAQTLELHRRNCGLAAHIRPLSAHSVRAIFAATSMAPSWVSLPLGDGKLCATYLRLSVPNPCGLPQARRGYSPGANWLFGSLGEVKSLWSKYVGLHMRYKDEDSGTRLRK